MSDDATSGTQSDTRLVIPAAVREKFSELVDLILQSQSMNDEERQYWIDTLPDMNDDQLAQLRNILVTERDQLTEIEKNFAMQQKDSIDVAQVNEQRMERAKLRSEKEQADRAQEETAVENVLNEME